MKKNYSKKHLYLWLFLLLITFHGFSQQKVFTGSVNDKTGSPISYALIYIKEIPGVKVFTDKDGKFSISGEIGQQLEVKTRDNRYKSLKIENDQIFVTINSNDELIPLGYRMELRKEEVTSAIGLVKADELSHISAWNPANALFGKLPGLTVLQNGGTNWNNDPNLFIRGTETYAIGSVVNNNILMIVDGFERPVSSLSLIEIESVAVLKDAAALAMYGMRGANGVLLITTKRGTGKGLSVDMNYEHGITKAFRLPDFLDSYGYATAVNQARSNDGLTPLYSAPELDRFKSGESPFLYPNVNWLNESLRDFGSSDKFSISFQEQASAIRYFTLVNFINEKGLLGPVNKNEGYSTQIGAYKFNFRSNVEINLSKSTKFTVNLAGNIGESNRPSSAIDESDVFSAIYNTPSAAFPVKTNNNRWGGKATFNTNPVAMISAQGYTVKGQREIMTDFILEQKLDNLLRGLSAEAGFSFDKSFNYLDTRTKQFQYEQLSPILDPVTGAITNTVATLYGTNTTLSFSSSVPLQRQRTTAIVNLKHSVRWNDNRLLSSLLFQSEELILTGQYNTFRHLLAGGNVHYSKAGKYFADMSLSYNGTNLLPENNRFGFFPAISLGWNMANEKWLVDNHSIQTLKIRMSWGMSGNDQIIQNLSKSAFVGAAGYYFGVNNTSNSGFREGRLASSPLTYETSYKTNLGIDAGLFNMLDLNFDAFYNKRKGILAETSGTTSGILGVNPPYSSVGIVTNKGFELGFNFYDNKGDFTYNLGGQISYTKNKIVDMLEVYKPEDYLKRTGHSINQAFGLEMVGFFKDATDISGSPKQTFSIVRPGDIKYKDQNGDKIINEFDEIPIGFGTQIPELYFSGSVNIEYKSIGISALLQGIANQTIYRNTPSIFFPLRSNSNISTFSNNAWTPANSATATLPRLSMSENVNNYRPNTLWYANGSYLKLRSLQFYYNLPTQFLSKFKLKETCLYVEGLNLFSFDNIENVDPEATGITYPTMTSFSLGVKIGF
jgi:TonB-linked SusC/RagA family outer membrane protein